MDIPPAHFYQLTAGLFTPPSSPSKQHSFFTQQFGDINAVILTSPSSPRKTNSCCSPKAVPKTATLSSAPTLRPFKAQRTRSQTASLSLLTPPTSPPSKKLPVRSRSDTYNLPSSPRSSSDNPHCVRTILDKQFQSLEHPFPTDGAADNPDQYSPSSFLDSLVSTSPSREASESSIDSEPPSNCLPAGSPSDSCRASVSATNSYGTDLTLPTNVTIPSPLSASLGTPTPVTQASPARSEFPFPRQGRSPSSLSPLALRRSPQVLRLDSHRSYSGSTTRSRTASQTRDRFIPIRTSPSSSRDSFHLKKPVEKLMDQERRHRQQRSGPDPFSRHIRQNVRLTEEQRALLASQGPRSVRRASQDNNGLLGLRRGSSTGATRQISNGAVWNVGGSAALADSVYGIPNGRGGMLGSGTNAPLYTSQFLFRSDPTTELEVHERRLALALDVDQSSRMLSLPSPPESPTTPTRTGHSRRALENARYFEPLGDHVWQNGEWIRPGSTALLDAPSLRDDYYCSLLAYSPTAKCLAVGLGSHVYLWSETSGVDTPDSLNLPYSAHVTSVAFSSEDGDQAILAVGRADGRVTLWSPHDLEPRFDSDHPSPVSCVSFRPSTVKRPSFRDRHIDVRTEELLVGDEVGHVYYYFVEWPDDTQRALFGWHGAVTLLAHIAIHTQQICGLAWSLEGEYFASGGNDNACHIFETKKVLVGSPYGPTNQSIPPKSRAPNDDSRWITVPGQGRVLAITGGQQKHAFQLAAAVKAIAFSPFQKGLLALGGGSNDRCIHFYHSLSGAELATIDCSAQVTSLIWSTTRREIAATFGFANPEHRYRVAVFAWSSCERVIGIEWADECRALYAIPYPGGPNGQNEEKRDTKGDKGRKKRKTRRRSESEGGVWWSRTQEEGCIVVATSDASIKFHEVWAEERSARTSGQGLLGGSDILEALHGIEKDEDRIIR